MAKLQVELVTPRAMSSARKPTSCSPPASRETSVSCRDTSLLTPLRNGEIIRNNGAEHVLSVAGGFLEVMPDKVAILADVAERAEDIDEAAAEEARKSAQDCPGAGRG